MDTNVLVAALLAPSGTTARVLALIEEADISLVVSPDILAEYQRVLSYPRIVRHHGLDPDAIERLVQQLADSSIVVEPADFPPVVTADPTDDMFLAVATTGDVSYIISGDAHILTLADHDGIPIVTPATFLAVVGQSAGD